MTPGEFDEEREGEKGCGGGRGETSPTAEAWEPSETDGLGCFRDLSVSSVVGGREASRASFLYTRAFFLFLYSFYRARGSRLLAAYLLRGIVVGRSSVIYQPAVKAAPVKLHSLLHFLCGVLFALNYFFT